MTEDPAIAVATRAAEAESDLRQSLRLALEQGHTAAATHIAQSLLTRFRGRRTDRFLHDLVRSPAGASAGLKPIAVALLSSFSSEFLHDSLAASGLASGLLVTIYQAGFGTFRQEILDPRSALYATSPDVAILAIEGEDWIPAAFAGYLGAPPEEIADLPTAATAELRSLALAFRAASTAPLLVHNLASPPWRALGIVDAKTKGGQAATIAAINEQIGEVAREIADVHVVDYAGLVNRHGALNWYDERMKLYARVPIASAMQHHLCAEYVKFLRAMRGLSRKCVVLDLDNTLWGGILGEDGLDGIALGPNYPGSAFMAFQRMLLDLHRRGVILAIASKNNVADVDEVFSAHRFMVLKKEHFAAVQVHWEPKSKSLARIADDLSIGLDHIVFVDDNPVECEEIHRALPSVHVVALPPQPERYAQTLQELALFDTLSHSAEDRKRGELYRQRALAEEARAGMASLEDYYRDLAMKIAIRSVDNGTLARTAQLTQKTNQFNVTTIRYTEAEVAKRLAHPDWIVATTAVRDRFGDNGIVGVTMARTDGPVLHVDTMLLSCRVIGRTVETAMLAHLCDEARRRGALAIEGTVTPTSKNVPARDVFARHGFVKISEDASGATRWRLALDGETVAWPSWFEREA